MSQRERSRPPASHDITSAASLVPRLGAADRTLYEMDEDAITAAGTDNTLSQ